MNTPSLPIKSTTSGCEILRCTSYHHGKCNYSAPFCKYSHEATYSRHDIALEALENISDRYQENPGDRESAATDMRDIADSALRRLMLDNPHARLTHPSPSLPFPHSPTHPRAILAQPTTKEHTMHTPTTTHPITGGIRKVYAFPNGYSASVVRHSFSYGNEAGLWELGVMHGGRLDYSTPITSDVLGYQTDADIDKALDAIAALPPKA